MATQARSCRSSRSRPRTRRSRKRREDPLWTCHRLALSDAEGEAELHVAGNAVSSSLLDMESRHLDAAPESRYVGVERVGQARLDGLVDELGLPADGVYLKVDVQGLESRVIEGARAALPRIAAIESELSLVPLYSDQLLFREMFDLLDDAGYHPVSLRASVRRPSQRTRPPGRRHLPEAGRAVGSMTSRELRRP